MGKRGGGSRSSGRIKDANQRIVLDEATRQRRARAALEALDKDNYHDDPHADLVANKNAPKFEDTLDKRESRKRKPKSSEFFKYKYKKTLAQLLEYEAQVRPNQPTYLDAAVPPSNYPRRHFCSVCGYPCNYSCTTCGMRYCSVNCLGVHTETRCLKWTS